MLATPLAQAVPGAPKNNDKFQTWHTEKKLNFITMAIGGEHVWIPSFEEVNRLVITSDDRILGLQNNSRSKHLYTRCRFRSCGYILRVALQQTSF